MRGEKGYEVAARRGKKVHSDAVLTVKANTPLKPRGHCEYCGETIAAKAPSRRFGSFLFHNGDTSYSCYNDYMAVLAAKEEIPIIIASMKNSGFSQEEFSPLDLSEKDMGIICSSFKRAREFINKLITDIKQAFQEIRNRFVHLIHEIYMRLARLTYLFKLPDVEFPAPAYPGYDV